MNGLGWQKVRNPDFLTFGLCTFTVTVNENKTGMDRFQDCCKAKATNALLQS